MAMKELVDRDCGGANPLMKLAGHYNRNNESILKSQSKPDDAFTAEFLSEHRTNMAPTSFNMDMLLHELNDIDRSNPRLIPGPDVVDVAADAWASQFLEDSKLQQAHDPVLSRTGNVWGDEFLRTEGGPGNLGGGGEAQRANSLWAHEYLDLLDEVSNQNAEFEEIFSAEAQKKNSTTSSSVSENLSQAAQELLDGVDLTDSKLANSEFMKFVKQITTLADNNLARETKQPTADNSAAVGGTWVPEFLSEGQTRTGGAWNEFLSTRGGDSMTCERVKEFTAMYPTGVKIDEWVPEFDNATLNETEELSEWYNDVPHDALAEKWASEFTAEAKSDDFWSNLQKQWEILAEEDSEGVHDWLTDYDKLNTYDSYKEYRFEKENTLEAEYSDPYEEGLKRLSEGDITSAVLLFEAAVKKDPQHSLAWQNLGTTQAANEHDRLAIAALRKCLELDEGNLTALLALAVSYTNESMQRQACDSLISWLKHHPLYSHLLPQDVTELNKPVAQPTSTQLVTSFVSSDYYNTVKDLLLKSVQTTPDRVDPDVQVALGTIFNIGAEYDKAVDCFTAALQVKPDDSLIWNKLGASLANGRRSEEAVDAYHRALDLSPGYVRTRYNLGVACVNLGAYKEALEHFLTALSLQHNGVNQSTGSNVMGAEAGSNTQHSNTKSMISESIWTSIRTTLVLLNRADLLSACDQKNFQLLNTEFNS